jgi:cell division septation protein DedD
MRRVRPDVSHRIRRQPSIFSVRWFRIAFGTGIALAVALFVGPSLANWLGGDLPRSLFLLSPWSGSEKTAQARSPEPKASRPSLSSPGALPPEPVKPPDTSKAPDPAKTAIAGMPKASDATKAPATTKVPDALKAPDASKPADTTKTPGTATAKTPSADGQTGAPPRVAASATPAPSASPESPKATTPRDPTKPASPPSATSTAEPLATPPSVYWVQVGAFLDHKNADRLVERLKGDGMAATTTSFEQSRVLYRVLLVGASGGRPSDDAVEKVRGLGHPIESTTDGPAVTGLVPLRKAVETSHALRQQGFPVRLKQEVSSSTYRVVRVGSFPTVAEADAALASLTAKGVEGVVVRER